MVHEVRMVSSDDVRAGGREHGRGGQQQDETEAAQGMGWHTSSSCDVMYKDCLLIRRRSFFAHGGRTSMVRLYMVESF